MDFKNLIKNLIQKASRLEYTIQAYLFLGIFWSVLGSLLALASESMLFLPSPWPGLLDYGHLKPVSSLILLFGAFLSFVLGLGYYILQEHLEGLGTKLGTKLKATLSLAALVCLKLHHLSLLIGIAAVLGGFNKGRMLGEMPWVADNIFIPALLAFPVLLIIAFASQKSKLKESSLLLIFLSLLGGLFYYLLGNFSFPTGLFTSSPLFTGIQDMALEQIYLSGLLYFIILASLLGLLYYYVPLYYKASLYSSSIPVFVSLALLLLVPLGAMLGLVHTAAPSWMQSLGIFSSMALNFAVMAGGLNAKYSITRSGKKYSSDAIGVMLRAGIFFLLLTALARALLAPSFMQAWAAYGTFAVRDPIFNIQGYALLLLFPLALVLLQKISGQVYARGILVWLAFLWILGAVLFYMGSLGAGLAEHSKASALDPEGQELLVQNWADVFLALNFLLEMRFGRSIFLVFEVWPLAEIS